ncbi:hypothetical protein LARI1_G006946 [Lachnellula arida]|uniref:Pentatricopeptide repeat domain-containing protein n=1 Tax=Lachnellula arida TaxID=1316785 RepID=A0A8T9B5L4_9HELO|nr:hypothetical protein LARI1_G006946 [Lachnellula arida]
MRPALQRLLLRPSSLELLRCLVGLPIPNLSNQQQCFNRGNRHIRRHASHALGLQSKEEVTPEVIYDSNVPTEPPPSRPFQISRDDNGIAAKELASRQDRSRGFSGRVEPQSSSVQHPADCPPRRKIPCLVGENSYGSWKLHQWEPGQMDYESSLDQPTKVPRLLDQDRHKDDLTLWAFLLEYRKRIHGSDGVAMFWDAFRTREIRIPPEMRLTDKLWSTFLEFGLKNHVVLEQIVEYAERMWISERSKFLPSRWEEFYSTIVQHFLIHGRDGDALHWHNILSKHARPKHKAFRAICHQVAKFNGDLRALEIIYHQQARHSIYQSVVPTLCHREDFKSALQWHYICMKHLDFPRTMKDVEPLLCFLQSLAKAQVPCFYVLPSSPEQKAALSREFTNRIHGEMMNVPEKSYNDPLGARWFATTWVSLDVAINAVHALGMREIGPLSLQAIALREPDPINITNRISQLKSLGISIGKSMFSRAIDEFSRNREYKYLEGLLASDQHPDVLEDARLQEHLLLSYVRAKDWDQYRRTLEIQALRGADPIVEKQNIILRVHAAMGDTAAVMEILSGMQRTGIKIKSNTMSAILRSVLQPRQISRRPMTGPPRQDLNLAIYILKTAMRSGSHVPSTLWIEIIRRLGMQGYSQGLENISIFLASWYGKNNEPLRPHYYRVPRQVPASHPLHPLRILFSINAQKAIVEWGFIHSLRRTPRLRFPASLQRVPEVTSGITLLKKLHSHGVHIDAGAVKKAVLNRLIAYYGPRQSNRLHNRGARKNLGFRNPAEAVQSLEQMVKQVDEVLGERFFTGMNLLKIRKLREERAQGLRRQGLYISGSHPWGRSTHSNLAR